MQSSFKEYFQLIVFQKFRLKTGEVLYEKVFISPRLPPKVSFRHDWTKELGSKVDRQPEGEVARQPEGEVARQANLFQPTQLIPNPIRDRTGRPVETGNSSTFI